jgi:hypothetical protein
LFYPKGKVAKVFNLSADIGVAFGADVEALNSWIGFCQDAAVVDRLTDRQWCGRASNPAVISLVEETVEAWEDDTVLHDDGAGLTVCGFGWALWWHVNDRENPGDDWEATITTGFGTRRPRVKYKFTHLRFGADEIIPLLTRLWETKTADWEAEQ